MSRTKKLLDAMRPPLEDVHAQLNGTRATPKIAALGASIAQVLTLTAAMTAEELAVIDGEWVRWESRKAIMLQTLADLRDFMSVAQVRNPLHMIDDFTKWIASEETRKSTERAPLPDSRWRRRADGSLWCVQFCYGLRVIARLDGTEQIADWTLSDWHVRFEKADFSVEGFPAAQ